MKEKVGTITVVCAGWDRNNPHPVIVLKNGDPTGPVSHGMCDACQKAMGVE